MMRHRPEVADVFRSCGAEFIDQFGDSLSVEQRRVWRAIVACRTAALGGHVQRCDHCGHERVAYNSCRNRHCPKCQAMARAKWLDARAADLLPVPYFHVVFTPPRELGPLTLQNKRLMYGLLFRAAAETLRALTSDPKHLGAMIGVLAVLHTWGQNLVFHPHLHCVCSGGGISADGTHWVHCKQSRRSGKEFFIPVQVLGRVFRGKFIALVKRAFRQGELVFHGKLPSLRHAAAFEQVLQAAVSQPWVVYAKRRFSGPARVLKYLARYTHRVAISNRRLLKIQRGAVEFLWKDYANGGKQKKMTLTGTEFIRRFLCHVLPAGFQHIRQYGFLANRFRTERLALCRHLLGLAETPGGDLAPPENNKPPDDTAPTHADARPCPVCKSGRMMVIDHFQPERGNQASLIPSACRSRPPPCQSP